MIHPFIHPSIGVSLSPPWELALNEIHAAFVAGDWVVRRGVAWLILYVAKRIPAGPVAVSFLEFFPFDCFI